MIYPTVIMVKDWPDIERYRILFGAPREKSLTLLSAEGVRDTIIDHCGYEVWDVIAAELMEAETEVEETGPSDLDSAYMDIEHCDSIFGELLEGLNDLSDGIITRKRFTQVAKDEMLEKIKNMTTKIRKEIE